ncbi:unnamed protein product [Candidula unifasciata]|uniref:tRNA-uridine aminocarboxypropyltransferase 1 n=1 Tax=Candidula unifasciata TaxID=100452 RepID=A0A8S3Z995_9EUPU|nr:unnamed protein product [Candidula unifasciata]
MEGNPFPDTIIADWRFLDASPRSHCRKCSKSRKYYCYSCCVPLPHLESGLPKVKLPVKVDIIKHPSETDGKSTAPHAVILAPEDVAIHTYPCIPDYDPRKVVLVFPGEHSLSLEDLTADCSERNGKGSSHDTIIRNTVGPDGLTTTDPGSGAVNGKPCSNSQQSGTTDAELLVPADGDKLSILDEHKEDTVSEAKTSDSGDAADDQLHKRSLADMTSSGDGEETLELPSKKFKMSPNLPFEKVVFIDATWNQTHNIINDERLKNLKRVELRTRNSNFWRTQEGVPKTYLSTIEAIYYFIRDLHTLFIDSEYQHEYDNLLFFFCHIYSRVQKGSQRAEKKV